LQVDGKVLAGGLFGTLGGQTRSCIGRVNATVSPSESLTASETLVTWLRGGSSPEVWRTTFEATTNGIDWQSLGVGTRIAGGWQLAGVTLPSGADIRGLGFIQQGYFNGSGGVVERITGSPLITTQPASRTNVERTTASFSVVATNLVGTPLCYQWRKGGTNLINGGTVFGATNATLILTNVAPADAGNFSVAVACGSGSVTSLVATLAIVDVVDSFNPGADALVQCMAVQTDGKILVGGSFTKLANQNRSCIARLNADGTLDPNFNPGASGQVNGAYPVVNAMAIQTDGKILLGGTFSTVGGQIRTNLARLNPEGTVDTNFNPIADGPFVNSLALQANGKILIGGWFTHLAGQSRSNLGRLNSDGTLDLAFTATANDWVYSLAVQPDGKIVVGGVFSILAGQTRIKIGRLNADGTLDTTFNPGANSDVYCVAAESDGKILVGGYFGTLGGKTRINLGRLNADGSVDTLFNAGTDTYGYVFSLALQADGRILVGGSFTTLAGQTRNRLGRLNSDGTLDGNFNPNADNTVHCVTISADGDVLIGGNFASLGGQTRTRLGRLNRTDPAIRTLNRTGSNVTWTRGGTSPEVWRTTLEASTNGVDWFSLGAGSRFTGGWQFSADSAPTNAGFRARGYVLGGLCSASTWCVESVLPGSFPTAPIIHPSDTSFGIRSNCFQFNIESVSSQTVVVEGSTNLTTWSAIQTNVMSSPGQVLIADPQWSNFPTRFYRVHGQ
jgi:uncharacterized delta-60 repeat protein